MFGLSQDFQNNMPKRIFAKKILYTCDVDIQGTRNEIRAEGSIRLGPLSDRVCLTTRLDSQGQFASYEIRLEKKKFRQSYKLTSEGIEFTSARHPEKRTFPVGNQPWLDPLSLLVQIKSDINGNQLAKNYQTFSGSKIISLQVDESHDYYKLLKNGKSFLNLHPQKNKGLLLEIEKVKVSLLLT